MWAVRAAVERSPLVLGLAAVFIGLTVFLGAVALATRELFVLVIAVPFGLSAYFMWYQASGRLRKRTRRRATVGSTDGHTRRSAGSDPRSGRARGGFGAGARRAAREARAGAGRHRPPDGDGPSTEEAYRRLDLDPGADEEAIRRAYRRKVKEVHPDAEGGDEAAFKRVTAAYERLTGEG